MGDNLPAVDLGANHTGISVTAGDSHTCVLLDDHMVKCWGRNLEGELGAGDTTSRGDQPGSMGSSLPPIDLGTGRTARAIAFAGTYHTCAILDDASVKCWGDNQFGQLGLGDTTNRGDHPNQMGDALPVSTVGTGRTSSALSTPSMNACALLDDGSIKCWGSGTELVERRRRRRSHTADHPRPPWETTCLGQYRSEREGQRSASPAPGAAASCAPSSTTAR